MKKIIFLNQKGGVGKTTTCLAVSCQLAKKYKVLAIDGDPQCNFSSIASESKTFDKTLDDVLSERVKIKETILKADFSNFDFIPSSYDLANADRRFADTFDFLLLKKAIAEIEDDYDFLLIDSPPAFGILSINYLMCTDYIVVPFNTSAFSVQGFSHLCETVKKIQANGNKELKYAGILLTKVNNNAKITQITKEFLNSISKEIDVKVFDTTIRQSIVVENSYFQRKNIVEDSLKAKSKIAEDYENFTNELLEVIK